MDPYGKKELLTFYTRSLDRFGDSSQALHWTPAGQQLRYRTLAAVAGDLDGRSLLDFGCGKGDLYGFLRGRGIDATYCGVDVNGKLVELARKKYPEAEFLAVDIEEETFDRSFDVIFICGVFNLRIAGIAESMEAALRKLFPLCREALHLNIPSTYTVQKDIDLNYAEPEEMLRFALGELSPLVTLRHGAPAGEMLLSVYRR
jgi:SAM-dependent methyltransferase